MLLTCCLHTPSIVQRSALKSINLFFEAANAVLSRLAPKHEHAMNIPPKAPRSLIGCVRGPARRKRGGLFKQALRSHVGERARCHLFWGRRLQGSALMGAPTLANRAPRPRSRPPDWRSGGGARMGAWEMDAAHPSNEPARITSLATECISKHLWSSGYDVSLTR